MVNTRTIALVKEFEGYYKELSDGSCLAYLDRNATPRNPNYDHKAGGLWTIGWGSTGPGIKEGTRWTKEQANANLVSRLNGFEKELLTKLTVKLNENQLGALTSIAYNVGISGIRGLITRVNKDPGSAGPYFASYKYGTKNNRKVVLAGLVRRRTAERELYEWEVPSQVTAMSPEITQQRAMQGGLLASLGLGGLSWDQVHTFAQDHVGLVLIGVAVGAIAISKIAEWGYHKAFNQGTYIPVGTAPVPTIDETEAF